MGKRVYAGPPTRTFMSKKARAVKRARYTKRKSNYAIGSKGNNQVSLYSGRRTSYRTYKNKLYNSLKFKESYRSYGTGDTTQTTTISGSQKTWSTIAQIPSNFYLTAGGYPGAATFNTEKLIIKGGRISMSFTNTYDSPIVLEYGLIRAENSTYTLTGTTDRNHDVSNFAGFGSGFRVMGRMKKIVIQPNDCISFSFKIPFHVINDLPQWATENSGRTYIAYNLACDQGGAVTVKRVFGHNLTFVADAIA